MGNTLRWTSLPSVCLLLLLAGQSRADITCKAVTSDTETNVTCDFGTDLKNSFNVHFFYPDIHAQPDPTLACNRLTSGELTCQYGGGVKFDEKQVGRTITLTGPPATDKTGGKYVCQSVPPLNVPNEPCTLTYEASPETGTGDSGNARDHGHYTLSLVTLIIVVLLLLLLAAFVFYVLHKKQVRKSGCQAPTQDENSTQVMLTPASNTTQETAPLAEDSSVDATDHGPKSAAVSIEMHEIEKGKAPQTTANANVMQFTMGRNTQAKLDPEPSDSEAISRLLPSDGAQASGSAEGRNILRVMILGQPGSGRSTTGDRLLDRRAFTKGRVSGFFTSKKRKCQWAEENVNNVLLQVTDIYFPGDKIDLEVVKSLALTSPGPHVVLMVIRCDQPFTQEDYQQYLRLTGRFGEGIKEYMIVVFTHLDEHGEKRDEQNQNLLQWMNADRNKDIVKVIKDSDDRYIGFNNEASRQDKKEQVEEILKKMNELKQSHGGDIFQNSYSEGVSQLVSSLVQARKNQKNETQEVAEKKTRESIAGGKESEDFYRQLLGLVRNKANPRAGSSKQTSVV